MRRKNIKPRISRINKSCAYFPCHKPKGGGLASNSQSHGGLEDCTFCYCPFYPCKNEKRGHFVYSKNTKLGIWSCQNCNWIHKKRTVDNILKILRCPAAFGGGTPQNDGRLSACTGIIILGHGSKLKQANAIMLSIIKAVKKSLKTNFIEAASLQFHQPSLSASIKNLAGKGCKNIIIVPFFLFMGNHVKRDVPKIIRKEKKIYPGVNFIYTRNIGSDRRITDIVLDCIREALR